MKDCKPADFIAELQATNDALRAENERLREALRKVREHLQGDPVLRSEITEDGPTFAQYIEAALADRGRG